MKVREFLGIDLNIHSPENHWIKIEVAADPRLYGFIMENTTPTATAERAFLWIIRETRYVAGTHHASPQEYLPEIAAALYEQWHSEAHDRPPETGLEQLTRFYESL